MSDNQARDERLGAARRFVLRRYLAQVLGTFADDRQLTTDEALPHMLTFVALPTLAHAELVE